MGNGIVRRYRAEPDVTYDHNAWRQPQPKRSGAVKPKAQGLPQDCDHSNWRQPKQRDNPRGADAAPQGAKAIVGDDRSLMSWSKAAADRVSPSAAPDDEEDDDDDISGFSNLADAATKVWEELMGRRECAKDFNSLFYLGELKDGVERAAKRVDVLRREAAKSAAKADEKKAALEDLCAQVEEKSLHVHTSAAQWKLGDIAIRRGKGLCELSTVHHEAEPPYFEVRMAATGSIAGTEAPNLVPLAPPQRAMLRQALRELEEARAAAAGADEALEQAQEELKQQHQGLADQVEKKLKETPAPASRSAAKNFSTSVPQGLPDIDLVRRWSTPAPDGAPRPELAAYPDMRGLREDLRTSGGQAAPAAHPSVQGAGAAGAQPAAQAPAQDGTPGSAPRAPDGFPSFEDLSKMAEDRAAGGPASYPSAHPAASRESFRRPAAADSNDVNASYRRNNPTPRDRSPQRSQQQQRPERGPNRGAAASREPSKGAAASGVPSGFPRPGFDPNDAQPGGPQAQATPPAQQAQQPPGPSPEVWVIYRTVNGQPYYHNESTNETAWALPPGARYREPTAPAASQQQQQQQYQSERADQEDPFADLRQREEQMRQQRDQWAQWYSSYCQWYQQQATSAPPQAGAMPGSGAQGPQGSQPGADAGAGAKAKVNLPPRGPQPPKLDAGFDDHATYAIKSSVLREMEAMVAKDAPMAQRKKAVRVLQMRWHPDKNPERLEVAKSVFQFIEETKPWFLHDPAAAQAC